MTDLSFDQPLQPSLLRPPITALPTRTREPGREPDVLTAYLSTTRSWSRHQVALPVAVVVALWVVLGGAAGVGGWLVAVRTGHASGGGIAYRIATLGHPGLLLVLTGICVVTLLGLVPLTRGLTRAGGPELAAVTVAGLAGAAALLGVVALALLAALAAFLTVAVTVAVFE